MISRVQGIMNHHIARNSVFLGLAAACRGLAEVFIIIVAIRALGPSVGGQLIFGLAVIRLAQLASEAGLGIYLTREIPRAPESAGTLTLEALKAVVLIALPAGLLLTIVTASVDPLTGVLVAIGTLAVIFGAAQPILGAAFLAHDQAQWQFKNTAITAVTLVCGGILVAFVSPSLLSFFVVVAVARGAGTAVGLLDFMRVLAPRVTLASLSARRSLRRSVPYALNGIGSFLYLRMDLLLLGVISGSVATGVYGGVADPMVSLTSMVFIITRSFLPSLSRAYGEDNKRFSSLVRSMVIINVCVGLALTIVVFIGSGLFVSLAFGGELEGAAPLLRVLSLAIVFRFFNSGLATWLTASGRQWQRTTAIMSGAAFNIVVIVITIPIWGYWAAAWATVATEFAILAVLVWFLRAELPLLSWGTRANVVPATVAEGGDVRAD